MHQVNYRRRTRRLSETDVRQVLAEAREDQYGWTSGGTVARAYDYPASTAAVAAIRLDDCTFAIRFGVADAHRDHSRVTWFGPHDKRDESVCRWLLEMRAQWQNRGKLPDAGWILLSGKEVTEILAETKP